MYSTVQELESERGGVEKGQRRNVFGLWPFLIIYFVQV